VATYAQSPSYLIVLTISAFIRKGGKIDTVRIFLNHILHNLIVDEYKKPKKVYLDQLQEFDFDPGSDNRDL
jgi:hypothetical protein